MKKPLNFNQKLLSAFVATMLFSLSLFSQQFLTTINGWNAYVHLPDDYSTTTQNYPTIIFFPGTGEVGTDASKLLNYGPSHFIASGWNGNVVVNGVTVKPIIISLQPAALYPQAFLIDQRIETIKSMYRVDTKRLSLTGLSMGGWTAEMYVQNSLAYATKIASVVALQAVRPDDNLAYPAPFTTYAQNCGRWLGYEQINDGRDMSTIANTMNAAVPGSAVYFKTNVGGGGHCCWNTWYDPAHTDNYSLNGVTGDWTIYQYMLTWSGCASGNIAPTANAGSTQTISLPTSSITLNGSSSVANGGATIASYSWAKTSGPAATISNAASAVTAVSGLVQGVYVFTLTVTDNNGLTSTSTVTITVNAAGVAPTANAGANQTLTLPTNNITLDGTGSVGNGGATISSYSWAKTSGPAATISNAASAVTAVSGLVQGVYVFTLTVTDNNGLTNTSTVTVRVNAASVAPTAIAGSNQAITLPTSSVTLNGSTSVANGGATISSYSWVKTSGPAATISNAASAVTAVSGLVQGTYVFTLTVTDNNGLTNTSTVTITVNAAGVAPTANAGANQTITLPTNNITLNGTGSVGNGGATISSYSWAKTSGPAATISNAASAVTAVSALVQGVYVFTLTVTDNNGLTNTSTVTITVNAASVAPTANAGANQTITLPTNNITLNGTGSVGNGGATISSYSWAKTSGPAATISNAASAVTAVSALVQGVYVFTLTVTDNNGLTNTSTVTITVNAASVAPTANAGANQTITLPTNNITLNGTGSVGNGGATISSYSWAKTSGPAATISNAASAVTAVSALVQGVYVFTLTVTDNNGLTNTSTVTITVNAASVAPTANAGANQTITLPTNNITLNGTGSVGNGGATISSYSWAKTSGPAATISNAASAVTAVSALVQGVYIFTLTITDNNGLTNTSTVTITVNAASVAPTANAGANQTITLPTNNITLNGTGSVGNGGATISSYSWVKTSGPAATISNAASAVTAVSALVQGVYVFTLTVTDNNGLTNTSTVSVTVYAAGNACGCDFTLSPNPADGQVYVNGQTLGAKPGDKVCLAAGNYTHIVLFNFYGSAAQPIQVINCGGQVKISGDPAYGFILKSSRYVNISGNGDPAFKYGISIDGTAANTNSGFGEGEQVSDIEVDHMEVAKVGLGVACAPTPNCDPATWSSSWKMYNMSFHDIYVHDTRFEGFYIGNTQAYYTMDCSGTTVTVEPQKIDSVKFYNNIIDKAGWTSAQISQVTGGVDIHDNLVTNFGYVNQTQHQAGIIVGGLSHGDVYNNKIISGTGNAFQYFGAGLTRVFNNVFANAGFDGTAQGQNAVLMSDRPKPPGYPGLKLYMVNNTIVNPKRNGISLYNDYGTVDVGNVIANNLIVAPGLLSTSPIYAYVDLQLNPHATLYNNSNLATTNLAKFADAANGDFHILSGSPAIDAGVSATSYGVMRDIDGNPRPYGAGYDIGAYEYNGGAPPPLTAEAGIDQTITLPVSSITLNGSLSTDPAGTITSYTWTQISGPNSAAISNGSAIIASVNNLVQGTYKFMLVITDNLGRTASDSMKVIVNPAILNPPPVANAGGNQNITLPTNTFSLNGSFSTDVGGTITGYAWTQISGPNTATIGNASAATTSVTNLIQGTYQFKLIVTDNDLLTGSDIMTLVVNPAVVIPPPVANAGGNQTISLPTNTITLDGTRSSDPGGTITNYNWTQVSGPNTASISNAISAVTSVNNLIQGTYQFSLLIKDDRGLTATDVMTLVVNPIVVNPPPVANAGGNSSITLPVNSATLNGAGSFDPGGSIVSYAWTQVSGPNTASISNAISAVTSVNNLIQGTYQFRLTVTDDGGLTASDIMTLIVNPAIVNPPPVAIAGGNLAITLPSNSATLNGSGSYDAGGSIVDYAWIQVSGPNTAILSNGASSIATVNGLIEGTYQFRLTVTDNGGLTAGDVMTIVVNPAVVNSTPIANAGGNLSITLPVNSTTLNGSGSFDPDGGIVSYTWTQVSGPNTATLTNGASAVASLNGLIEGTYQFRITVTDNGGLTAADVMTIVVNPAAIVNSAPIANAGGNLSITLPVNSATLNGSGSFDPDGSIVSYTWTLLSGPNTATLTNGASAVASLNGLIEGTYQFRITVTDNGGLTAADVMTIVVNPAAIVNSAPIANAGGNLSITLPVNSATLNGSGSFDPDGSIVSYTWTLLSGPNTATLTNGASAVANLNGLIEGTYQFQLTVTDNGGLTAADVMTIVVNPAAIVNSAPIANAGGSLSITLPVNSATLNGSGSFDPDGSIVSYTWTQVSGPNTATLTNGASAVANLNGLIEGTYQFRLVVTDNSGLTGSDIVTLVVSPAIVSQPPVANAGGNQSIYLPTNSSTLNGSLSTDPGGTITGYKWTQISGPGTASIANSTGAISAVNNLAEGTYQFQLVITDDRGMTSTDVMTLVVNAPIVIANQPPVADAGPNQVLAGGTATISLDGSRSYDPDGTIVKYDWVMLSGAGGVSTVNSATSNPIVVGLKAGVYVFELTVTDNGGAIARSTTQITVNALPGDNNLAPIANAGRDTVLYYYANTKVTLDASASYDPDGSIVSYLWRQISGPGITPILHSVNSVLEKMSMGVYEFELTVTDNKGLSSKDTVKISVLSDNLRTTESIKVYPNPVETNTTLEMLNDATGKLRIMIYDISGKLVDVKEYNKQSYIFRQELNMSKFLPGSYILNIYIDGVNKPFTFTLIKQ